MRRLTDLRSVHKVFVDHPPTSLREHGVHVAQLQLIALEAAVRFLRPPRVTTGGVGVVRWPQDGGRNAQSVGLSVSVKNWKHVPSFDGCSVYCSYRAKGVELHINGCFHGMIK